MATESRTRMITRMSGQHSRLCHRLRIRIQRTDVIGIAVDHPGAEVGEFLADKRGTGMMGRQAPVFWSKTEGYRHVELAEGIHLPVEPIERVRAETVGP